MSLNYNEILKDKNMTDILTIDYITSEKFVTLNYN